ncbi:DUF5686 and carboxypeptidase-like regulatory domain-containing protein [Tellurirhabdus rosea]|uniref:DUF5686 and carboxypeptidase-like regulatory domain-containing protein n=1 Tax=Tellurirhabdus rosea TaxID=2674997 RepID=UPI0022521C42|nr:DUF5686 and carboxypeptidase-like regulatory domain-containing protein [Tellurirhabdus rosea]
MRRALWVWMVWMVSCGWAQAQAVTGSVRDAQTRQPLAFVSIALKDTRQGTVTDLDGRFRLAARPGQILLVSYVGYNRQEITIPPGDRPLLIDLQEAAGQLTEVVVRPGENPAWPIIRQVLRNRSRNDPEQYEAYRYLAYNKSLFTVDQLPMDTTSKQYRNLKPAEKAEFNQFRRLFTEQMHFWVKESLTEVRFQKPDQRKEIIRASKSSLPKDFSAGFSPTDFQPFGFYKDVFALNFVNRTYVNPISEGTFRRYDFVLEDTLFHERDSTYVLSFEPLPGKNFEGLRGLLYVNTDGYALENIIVSPADTAQKVRFRVQQRYRRTDGRWFPDWLETDIGLPLGTGGTTGELFVRNRSQLSEVILNQPLKSGQFDYLQREQTAEARTVPDSVWARYRTDTLTRRERDSYVLWDTLALLKPMRRFIEGYNGFLYVLSTGLANAGKLDVVLRDLIRFNRYEGTRFGLGLQTSSRWSQRFRLYGYAAYGTRDRALKYGGEAELKLWPRRDGRLVAGWRQDVAEPGQLTTLGYLQPSLVRPQPRNWYRSRMDSVQVWRLDGYFRPLPGWQVNLYGQRERRRVTDYPFTFRREAGASRQFVNSELGLNLRFAPREQVRRADRIETVLIGTYPVLELQVAAGIPAPGLGGEFSYTRLTAQLDQQFISKALGTTRFRLQGGWLAGVVPYPYLFNGPGSWSGDRRQSTNYFAPNTFQTMGLYEFASDRFAYLFWEHNFGRLLVRPKNQHFQPEIGLVQNVAWGTLETRAPHEPLTFGTLERGFYESGLKLSNLLRARYGSAFWLGVGVGAFYRWGPYQKPLLRENLALRLNIQFSI